MPLAFIQGCANFQQKSSISFLYQKVSDLENDYSRERSLGITSNTSQSQTYRFVYVRRATGSKYRLMKFKKKVYESVVFSASDFSPFFIHFRL